MQALVGDINWLWVATSTGARPVGIGSVGTVDVVCCHVVDGYTHVII